MTLNLIDIRQLNTGQLASFVLGLVTGQTTAYRLSIASGANSFDCSFGNTLNAIPSVMVQVASSGVGTTSILASINSVTLSGCSGNFSNTIPASGYYATLFISQ